MTRNSKQNNNKKQSRKTENDANQKGRKNETRKKPHQITLMKRKKGNKKKQKEEQHTRVRMYHRSSSSRVRFIYPRRRGNTEVNLPATPLINHAFADRTRFAMSSWRTGERVRMAKSSSPAASKSERPRNFTKIVRAKLSYVKKKMLIK